MQVLHAHYSPLNKRILLADFNPIPRSALALLEARSDMPCLGGSINSGTI